MLLEDFVAHDTGHSLLLLDYLLFPSRQSLSLFDSGARGDDVSSTASRMIYLVGCLVCLEILKWHVILEPILYLHEF